jgi:putative ABC transport system permease protein
MIDFTAEVRRRLVERRVDPTLHASVLEELSQHLDDRYRSLLARGLDAAAAEASVLQELDDDALTRELRGVERMMPAPPPALGTPPPGSFAADWREDVRYATRSLSHSPGFTVVAVLTLALGVGATTAIFSVVNAVMVRPLPWPQADRLIRVWESNPEGGWPQFAHSFPNFLDWRAQQTRFETLAAFGGATFALTTADGAELVRGLAATADFLPLLRVTPALGRNFTADEDRPGGHTTVVLLGDGFARRRFADPRAALDQTLVMNGRTFTVIGVLPASFQWGATPVDILVPLVPDPARNRADHRTSVFGRLRDGATLDEARAELAAIAAALAQQYPDSNRGWGVRAATFYDWLIPEESRSALIVLLGAVAIVFLIACANVTSLLLARAATRQKELSIRVALGAMRFRILRQLLTESLLLALLAGLVGLGVTAAAIRLLVAFGPDGVPRLDEVSFDRNVLAFGLALAALSSLIFGLVPALHATREQPSATLHDAARGNTGGAARQRLRSLLTVGEVALSVALLIGAGLLLRSFGRLQAVEPGFEAERLMTLRLNLPGTSYPTSDHHIAFYRRLLDDMRSQPGLVAAATTSSAPLSGSNTSSSVVLLHRQAAQGEQLSADWRLVSPGYFAAMGIPLRGRDFTPGDRADTPVAIISETMARRFWPNEDPLGRSVVLRSFGDEPLTIIGIAGDVRSAGFESDPAPMTYGPALTYGGWNPMTVVWRSATDPATHLNAIRDAVRRIDPAIPIFDVRTLDEMVANSFGPRLFNTYALGIFAVVALMLAALGLFGVMAYLVAQRTREIGVRLALGAERRDIFRLIMGRGLALTLAGAAIGVTAAFWLTRLMSGLLFSVSATDPRTFVAVPAVLVGVALLACYVPARRAMRVDPVRALRAE